MKEWTVPTPPYHTCAERDDDVVPVQVVSHLGGAPAEEVKPPRAFRFLKTCIQSRENSLFFLDNFRTQRTGSVVF